MLQLHVCTKATKPQEKTQQQAAHEFEVAEVVALVLLLNTILRQSVNLLSCANIQTDLWLKVHTLDKAKGVFIMPALHISTSTAGGSYAAANDSTDDRSCRATPSRRERVANCGST